ncbi:hypothetical protein F66182_7885 [Fusarium sp. NRRL 66182]|nr:hypothetical protein F66182_7885 [Fusarium sp. NRRL 66182]
MILSQDPPRDQHQNLSKRKHRQPESSPSPRDDEAHGSSKRRKLQHPTVPPPAFWDGLSTVPLCASALTELDRRNARRALAGKDLSESTRRSRRLRARRSAADDGHLLTDLFLGRCSAKSLKGIKGLARHGGPDLTELRGCRAPGAAEQEMSCSQSSLGRRKRGSQSLEKRDSSNTTVTRSTKAYDPAFQQHLIDNGILPDDYEYPDGRYPPELSNVDDLMQRASRPRASLSPSRFTNDDFRRFKRADTHATKESQVVSKVIPFIEGNIRDSKCTASNITFTNLDPLTDGTLVAAKPDTYYGARPEQLDRRVRRELGGHIIPSPQHDLPIAPNMFVEVKGPDGSAALAKRQISYDMALGERAQFSLRSFRAPAPIFDNKASTIGYTYLDGTLKMYATHLTEPSAPGRQPGYVMTQVGAYAMTNDIHTFRQGAAAYRNGRDLAKEKRDEAIESANKMVRDEGHDLSLSFGRGVSSNTEPTSQDTISHHESNRTASLYDSDTSADPTDLIAIGKRHKVFEDTTREMMNRRNQQGKHGVEHFSVSIIAGEKA